MVWENIEEMKSHTTLFIRSSQFIFSNKVLDTFFFIGEIFPEQNFLID
jgi:hypothetical protein